MTKNKKLKERARARMAVTREPYTAALAGVLRQGTQREPTLRAVRDDLAGADDRMTEIVRRFPLLRGAVEEGPFRGERFLRWLAGGHSSGGLLAGQFVLQVWRPDADLVALGLELGIEDAHVYFAPLDLSRALRVWDEAHRVAFLAWADPARFADAVVEDEGAVSTPAEAYAIVRRARERELARRQRWPKSGTGNVDTGAAMTSLARMLLSLHDAEGLEPFDTETFMGWVAAHPETAPTARFLLHVWNSDDDFAEAAREFGLGKAERLFERFRVVRTFEDWDEEHRRAFLAWAEAPFWP